MMLPPLDIIILTGLCVYWEIAAGVSPDLGAQVMETGRKQLPGEIWIYTRAS